MLPSDWTPLTTNSNYENSNKYEHERDVSSFFFHSISHFPNEQYRTTNKLNWIVYLIKFNFFCRSRNNMYVAKCCVNRSLSQRSQMSKWRLIEVDTRRFAKTRSITFNGSLIMNVYERFFAIQKLWGVRIKLFSYQERREHVFWLTYFNKSHSRTKIHTRLDLCFFKNNIRIQFRHEYLMPNRKVYKYRKKQTQFNKNTKKCEVANEKNASASEQVSIGEIQGIYIFLISCVHFRYFANTIFAVNIFLR